MQPNGLSTIPFIDAHHHLWDIKIHRYSWLEGDGDPAITEWLGDYSGIRHTYLVNDYLRDAQGSGLVKSIHVQAGWSESDLAGETRWIQGLADRYGFPNGIIADVDLRADDVERQLDRHAEYPNFRGVRMLPMTGLITDLAFQRGFAALDRRKFSYDLNTRVPYISEGVEIARKFPDTTILICNTGNPMERSDAYYLEWRNEMAELAAFPNVVVKISGLGMSDHAWTVETVRPWILTAIDLFGPERSLFASNWPVDGLYSSFQEVINTYHILTDSYSLHERTAMFATNAERYYLI